jgi:serine protease AprX
MGTVDLKAWEWSGRVGRAGRLIAGSMAVTVAGALVAPGVAVAAPHRTMTAPIARPAGPMTSVIVREAPGAGNGPEHAVAQYRGRVGRHIAIIDGFVATVPKGAISLLRQRADVSSVTENRAVHFSSYDGFAAETDAGSTVNAAKSIGADDYWAAGYTGEGVDVAVIDSGVSRVTGLGPSQVVYGPDYSFEANNYMARNVDTFGHGTHMAGLIAGNDTPWSTPRSAVGNRFVGMAPDARIVSIKVADEDGASDVSQVLLAIDWVVRNRNVNGFNIRVLNLSFGTDGTQDYKVDPLTFAAEKAWQAGIVVVVAGGNTGEGDARLNDPAYDPYVLAVGAADTKGTETLADDNVASFSAKGNDARHPDLLAPGKSLVSLAAPGSTIVNDNPGGRVAWRFLRGSGTSQAAAITSGAAALVVQQRPTATPDQVKALLMNTANPLAKGNAQAQGKGLLDLHDALTTRTPSAVQTWVKSTGKGLLELTRGSAALNDPNLVALADDIAAGDVQLLLGTLSSNRWSSNRWSSNRWSANRWSSNRWSSNRWSSDDWK